MFQHCSLQIPSLCATQKQLLVTANQIDIKTKRTFLSTRNMPLGKSFAKKLKRRSDSSKTRQSETSLPRFFFSPSLLCMPRERTVQLKLIGFRVGPPTPRRSPAPIRRVCFSSSAPHWRSRTDDELILVKYSCARAGLKIGWYIKRAVEPRRAALLSGRQSELRRCLDRVN